MTESPSPPQVSPRLLDALLGIAVALGVALVIAAEAESAQGQPPAAYLFALGFGALMVWRRHWPRVVLVLTVLGIFIYYALGFPPIGISWPAVAAIYSGAEQGRTRTAMGAGAILVAVAAYFRIDEGLPAAYLISYEMFTNVALIAAAIALGVSVRTRRYARRQQARILELTTAEHARRSAARLQAEREQIARDLHDSIGHSLAVVSMNAGVAAEALGRDEPTAQRALAQIRESAGETLRELRATVRLLRTAPTSAEGSITAPGLAGLESLLDAARGAGLQVDAHVGVPGSTMPALSGPIDAAAFRIVQESLTNVVRHAGATQVRVTAAVEEGWLVLEVRDDGHGALVAPGTPRRRMSTDDAQMLEGAAGSATTAGAGASGTPAPPSGHGIDGMRERATLLGGTLTAGDAVNGGFVVRAALPARLDA
ncbi:sensor histidine kinase [Ruania halotolerans]|uniref:sensor histidine kinase n=1 Tax=Ruania halotolerans TaxID=2897773 RepID=UPI001E4CF361|nr:sensor histidine kinase [Ruania halotolerans]UFU06410.1 sensor histidine kinase [Ruania halotolerans]